MPLTARRRPTAPSASLPLLLAAVLACFPVAARAACAVSGSGPAFGAYSSESPLPTEAVGLISVTCSNLIGLLVEYEVSLLAGGSGSVGDRRLSGPLSSQLSYQLFTDAARTQPWGDGSGGTTRLRRSVLLQVGGMSDNIPIYGRLLTRQRVAAGGYSDILTVTLDY